MHWHGGSSAMLGECCCVQRRAERADPGRLRDVLDRHNVTIAEWIVLAAMEDAPIKPDGTWLAGRIEELASRDFKATISAAECCNALDTCLQHGWLKVLCSESVDAVHAILLKTPALLAVPGSAELRMTYQQGDVDFSPSGADLYRTISAEWLGTDWETDLSITNSYFWEEHRYCESAEEFQSIIQQHAANGTIVRAHRTVRIGPWCVYWWKRFASGYQLQLEIGAV